MTSRTLEQRLDAYLALEQLTLGAVSQAAGLDVDWASYRDGLLESIQSGVVIDEWHGDQVIALATFKPITENHWFVTMLALHPAYRGPKRLWAFLQKLQGILQTNAIAQLSSHVLKNNTPSVSLHRKLGFKSVQENELALAFELSLNEVVNN